MNSGFVLCLALFIASNLWFYLRVLMPIQQLARQAAQLSEGNLESMNKAYAGIGEIEMLRRAMVGMVGHVRRAQEQQRAYADRLLGGQETERKRIARELHDDTVQSLVAIAQSLDLALNTNGSDPELMKSLLQSVREQALDTITSLRNLIGDLRPPALDEFGLVTALEMQIQKIHGIDISLSVGGTPRRLSETNELTLFRIVQEAIANVCRHSSATQVQITVDYRSESIRLAIYDNGVGFSPPADLNSLSWEGHYGLLGIQERVRRLNGTFLLKSAPAQGTKIEILLPLKAVNQPDHLVRDPVCTAMLHPEEAYGSVEFEGERYYFCCPVCQGAFQKESHSYLADTIGS